MRDGSPGRSSRATTAAGAALVLLALATVARAAPPERDAVFDGARAHWRLGEADVGSPLTVSRGIDRGLPAVGANANAGAKVARVLNSYFDAGRGLGVEGDAVTVYLRARDPRAAWNYGLLAKRGGHDFVNYNLYGIAMNGTPVIGFEVKTDVGFYGPNAPASALPGDPAGWHDLVGRYDGKEVQLIADGKVVARAPAKGRLHQNDEPTLIGAETDRGHVARPFTGEMEEAAVWARALSDAEIASLMRVEKLDPGPQPPPPYASPIHYRPAGAILADTIPFFWEGTYHVFYLKAGHGPTPWEHVSSTDLVNWTEHPTALPPGKPGEPDAGNVFTGSVIEDRKGNGFHIFYTGWAPGHPGGREQIMHATSPDLITWTKHPRDTFGADGVVYQNNNGEDFRDPFILWNDEEQRYWMLLCARDAKKGGAPCTGVMVSKDLTKWEPAEPLTGGTSGTPECPDLFKIGDTWYLIFSPSAGSTVYRYSKTGIRGPYLDPDPAEIDTPILYAAKRMYDGRRHVLTGWQRDLGNWTDGGPFQWGGTQSVAREMYAGPDGMLRSRPVPEALVPFEHEVFSLRDKARLQTKPAVWALEDGALKGTPGDTRAWFDVPDNYLLTARVTVGKGSTLTLGFREQPDGSGGYGLALTPDKQHATIRGPGFDFPRRCPVEPGKPLDIKVFVQGTIIEAFIDDGFAYSTRAYNFPRGKLTLKVEGAGDVTVHELSVKTHAPAR
jgi:beta-fructofuranosidase